MKSEVFRFDLGAEVMLSTDGVSQDTSEGGLVIARAEYLHNENSYLVRYVAADGRLVQVWWAESAVVKAPS